MAQQTINVGAAPNDGTGTPLRTAFQYTNSNFTELYTAVGPSGNNIVVPGSATITGDLTVDTNVLKVNTTTNRVGINTTAPNQNLEITGSGNPLAADGCSAVRLNNTVSGRPAVVGVDDSQNFVIWNVGTEVSETIKFLTGSGNGKEQYRITHGGVFNWYDGAGGTRMTLNSTGLGVGVSPTYNIDVLGATLPTISVRSTLAGASNARLYLECAGTNSGHITYNRSLQALTLGATGGTTAQVTLDSAGNVGVGVTPSAWGTYKALEIGTIGTGMAGQGYETHLLANCYYNAGWKYARTERAARFVVGEGLNDFRWFTAASGTAGNAITFTQAMTLDASGRLLIGTVTSGTAAGDGVVKLGTYGHCISQTGTSIASGSYVDLTVATGGVGYQGFLSVANTLDGNANSRTQTTYSVFGRGTSSTITQIATADGSTSGASFTVTTPSNGVIRITNTSGNIATISAQFFGGSSA